MKLRLFTAMLFSMLGLTFNAQAQATSKQEDEALKQRLQRRILETRSVKSNQKSVQFESGKYNHKDQEILSKLNTEAIPDNFPLYKSEYTDEQYTILMNKWYNANPTLLKGNNEQKQ